MKNLTLKKTETGRKDGQFLYEVVDPTDNTTLATRRSNRDYVAAAVYQANDRETGDEIFVAENFFGRIELATKDVEKFGSRMYGLATLKPTAEDQETFIVNGLIKHSWTEVLQYCENNGFRVTNADQIATEKGPRHIVDVTSINK